MVTQLPLAPEIAEPVVVSDRDPNRIRREDRGAHDWYRFVLSFPPHLVREYINRFSLDGGAVLLDPFCGTGTTLVESQKHRIQSIGIEGNPVAHFASRVKTDWGADPAELLGHAESVSQLAYGALDALQANERLGLPDELQKLLLKDSVSPLPLHKTLVLLEAMTRHASARCASHERLALAKALVFSISNLEFGPEIGVGRPKDDAPVIESWLSGVRAMARDLEVLRQLPLARAVVHLADARHVTRIIPAGSVDAVITSPPYPNEKDYTRTTRLESVVLGFVRSKQDLRALKQGLIRSNTRGVYKADSDDALVGDNDDVQDIADAIENRRIELNKDSGFERLYPRLTRLYFGGMQRHLADLREVLRPGARLAYVVGDQASYLQVMIRTGQLLGDIAESLGFEVDGIDLFRTRLATATKQQLREEVLVLRWPGSKRDWRRQRMTQQSRYAAIIERIFLSKYREGSREIDFEREDIVEAAHDLGIDLPKNLGDLIYSLRYRTDMPESIRATAGDDIWIIKGVGRAKYRFVLSPNNPITPNTQMVSTKIPDATPGVVTKYALSDEQALLAKLRYNRLVDIFTGVTCYSLQNHLRTQVPGKGQAETDELYVGVDKKGAHYVIPVQAKGGRDRLNIVQIEQDIAVCSLKFPSLICRPLAAQFMPNEVIALFEFGEGAEGVGIVSEKHYRLVAPDEVTDADLAAYQVRE